MSLPKTSTKSVTRSRVASSNLLQYATESRIDGHFNDLTIVVGDERIAANQLVLSCHSVFFEKKLKSKTKKNINKDNEQKVEIKGFDSTAVKCLIDYIYTGSIDIDDKNVMKLLAAANYMQLLEARNFCFEFLLSNIGIDNWFDTFHAISLYRGNELKTEVYRCISAHFDEVAQTDDFKLLCHDDLKELIPQMDKSRAKKASICQGIMNWI